MVSFKGPEFIFSLIMIAWSLNCCKRIAKLNLHLYVYVWVGPVQWAVSCTILFGTHSRPFENFIFMSYMRSFADNNNIKHVNCHYYAFWSIIWTISSRIWLHFYWLLQKKLIYKNTRNIFILPHIRLKS